MPALSSLNADESMMATFVGAGAGRVCVCARIAKAASAATATIMRNTFIALGSLKIDLAPKRHKKTQKVKLKALCLFVATAADGIYHPLCAACKPVLAHYGSSRG